ncbi:hypothetical protein NC653_003441 [Populus alba x Populus x berolinensis]|uniref:Uncharacterized protein n=1 Tax=Populus alba x Populus x berolinensis TaxID=444605 RepID=A0AAD6RRJ1_9ROSI|nr:hypothetical protein NC653_003441 [Populus alba x Populus x berolinensis]
MRKMVEAKEDDVLNKHKESTGLSPQKSTTRLSDVNSMNRIKAITTGSQCAICQSLLSFLPLEDGWDYKDRGRKSQSPEGGIGFDSALLAASPWTACTGCGSSLSSGCL